MDPLSWKIEKESKSLLYDSQVNRLQLQTAALDKLVIEALRVER
jgi:hypothetical protein